MNFKSLPVFIVSLLLFTSCNKELKKEIDLSGQWHYKLDPKNVGEEEDWPNTVFEKTIELPGTLDDAQIGKPLEHEPKMDIATLTSLHRKHSYIGSAWYQKEVEIPSDWEGKFIELELERIIWESTLWIDGEKVGFRESLVAPHRYDLSDYLSPGKHTLTIRIDNTNKYPDINVYSEKYPEEAMQSMAHGYTNHTQVKWNGILGDIKLHATSPEHMENIQVYPDLKNSSVKVVGKILNTGNLNGTVSLEILDPSGETVADQQTEIKKENGFSVDVKLSDPELWHEFNPVLYKLVATLRNDEGVLDKKEVSFGFSQVSRDGEVLKLNNQRIFLRGNLECAIFPLTGYPPTEKEEWAELISKAKDYGLNHLRFHSYCPPEAAFEAADEAGFYLQAELALWNLEVGEHEETNEFLIAERERLLKEYGNHPSFILFSLGNELEGNAAWMNNQVAEMKQKDDRRLYTATTFSFQEGFGAMPRPNDDFFVTQWTNDGWVRGQEIFNTQSPSFNKDYTENIKNVHVPIISHEIGQYSVFPDFGEIEKYTGNLAPLNFIAIRNAMESKGLLHLSEEYLQATGEFAALLYKEEIERALKTKGFDGFQLLQLQDFPGQGTALVGLLNSFWESKGAITGKEFREFNSELVPLARFEKAAYENNEAFKGSVEIANFFKEMKHQELVVRLKDGEEVFQEKSFDIETLEIGNAVKIGDFSFNLEDVDKATKLVLETSLVGTEYMNHWNIWVYPSGLQVEEEEVVYTRSFQEAEQALREGKKVLLNPHLDHITGVPGKFLPVFWSPVHFPNQPGTMGILVDPEHKAFAEFPTSAHSDWQWWDLNINSRTLHVDSLNVEPVVRMIDNFFTNRNLATVFESKVGEGKLVFSSIDLSSDLDNRPVARQFKYSLFKYMNSSEFAPEKEMDYSKMEELLSSAEALEKKEYDIYQD